MTEKSIASATTAPRTIQTSFNRAFSAAALSLEHRDLGSYLLRSGISHRSLVMLEALYYHARRSSTLAHVVCDSGRSSAGEESLPIPNFPLCSAHTPCVSSASKGSFSRTTAGFPSAFAPRADHLHGSAPSGDSTAARPRRAQVAARGCPFRLTHPDVWRTCGRSSRALGPRREGHPTGTHVFAVEFRQQAEEDRGEPH
jgi:hypothetical protein